jgi:hypothetical protein
VPRPRSAVRGEGTCVLRASRVARIGPVGQNVGVGTVLIRLPGGAGVVRLVDGATVVTGDVDEGRGAFLREEDPYQPANS